MMTTDYELSEQHMKALFVSREPLSLAEIRGEHWDAFIRKVKADALREFEKTLDSYIDMGIEGVISR